MQTRPLPLYPSLHKHLYLGAQRPAASHLALAEQCRCHLPPEHVTTSPTNGIRIQTEFLTNCMPSMTNMTFSIFSHTCDTVCQLSDIDRDITCGVEHQGQQCCCHSEHPPKAHFSWFALTLRSDSWETKSHRCVNHPYVG